MKSIKFIDWIIEIESMMDTVVDTKARKMVITEGPIESVAFIWMDDNDKLQIKPTWDSIISIDHSNKILTIKKCRYIEKRGS